MREYEGNYGKYLSTIKKNLNKGESIKKSVFGMCEGVRTGIIAATDTRLVFFVKKVFGHEIESFPYNKISSLERSKGAIGEGITIFTSNNKAKMRLVTGGSILQLLDFVETKLNPDSVEQDAKASTNTMDIPSQIERLADLRDKGIVTEEELNQEGGTLGQNVASFLGKHPFLGVQSGYSALRKGYIDGAICSLEYTGTSFVGHIGCPVALLF